MKTRYFLVLLFLWQPISFCQLIGPVGLAGKKVTSLTIVDNTYEKLLVAGTESSGMNFHNFDDDDSVWIRVFFSTRSPSCVYAQPVSPSLTKLFMALVPDSSIDKTLIYTNIMPIQSALPAEDSGLDKSKVKLIKSIAGFAYTEKDSVMPAYCCTNDPNIYVNEDRIWTVSRAGEETVTLNFVYTSDSTVWAGGFNNGPIGTALLLKSTDYGKSWENIILPLGEIFSCYSICVSPNNPDTIYVGLNEFILKSTDKGKKWLMCLDVQGTVFTSIEENPLKPGEIFAGGRTCNNDFILYKSTNDGGNWEPVILTCNCIIKGINDMEGVVINNQFQLYIATDGSGIWKYYDKVTKVENEEIIYNGFYLYQNYPNPFNPETNISFEILDNDRVTLKIYDLLGKEIAALLNDVYKQAGFYSVKWDSKNSQGKPMPSGIYICRLVSGNQSKIIKMTLTR